MREPRNRVVQVRRFGGPDELEVVDAPLSGAKSRPARRPASVARWAIPARLRAPAPPIRDAPVLPSFVTLPLMLPSFHNKDGASGLAG